MTTTVNSASPTHDVGAIPHSLSLRVRARRHRSALTGVLAQGADPSASDELAFVATKLVSPRRRRMLARSLRRTIREADDPTTALTSTVTIDRRGIRDAEGAIVALIGRLDSPRPVQAKGMAMVERLLTNTDDESPLYSPAVPGTVRRAVETATAALDPEPSQTHEFSIGA
jgi:hypothetical protein